MSVLRTAQGPERAIWTRQILYTWMNSLLSSLLHSHTVEFKIPWHNTLAAPLPIPNPTPNEN